MMFQRNTFKKILESQGASRISKDAAVELARITEEELAKVIRVASEYASHSGRKTIMKEDVRRALKDLNF